MATDAEKVKMYREKAKDATIPQEVRNTYLDRANELERKAYEATKVPEKKMANGGAVSRVNSVGVPLPTGNDLRASFANDMLGVKKMAVKPQPKLAKQKQKTNSIVAPVMTASYFAKGGAVKKAPAKASAKGGKPVVAIMVGMAKPKGKTMMNKGGMAKKGKC